MTDVYISEQHSATPDTLVDLFEINALSLGAEDVFYLSPGTFGGNPPQSILWNGVFYLPIPIEITDVKQSLSGLPRPTLKVSNAGGLLGATMRSLNDLVGASVIRTRTYATFLDAGDTPDTTQFFGPDKYVVARKASENEVAIEFELVSILEQDDVFIPGRYVFKDTCPWIYRRFDAEASTPGFPVFDTSKATCPYAGSATFNLSNQASAPEDDKCDKKTKGGCTVRFGENGVLPTGAFPGLPDNVR